MGTWKSPYVVKVNGENSMSFVPDEGLPQGDSTSPPQFNIYSKHIIQTIERECAAIGIRFTVVPGKTVTNVTFADDITGTVQANRVAYFLRVVEMVLAQYQLTLSRAKCKVLLISGNSPAQRTVAGLPIVPSHQDPRTQVQHRRHPTSELRGRTGQREKQINYTYIQTP